MKLPNKSESCSRRAGYPHHPARGQDFSRIPPGQALMRHMSDTCCHRRARLFGQKASPMFSPAGSALNREPSWSAAIFRCAMMSGAFSPPISCRLNMVMPRPAGAGGHRASVHQHCAVKNAPSVSLADVGTISAWSQMHHAPRAMVMDEQGTGR